MVTASVNEGKTRMRAGGVVPIVGERFCLPSEERQLTVQKTSLFYPGDGFAVYEHHRRRGPGSPEKEHHRPCGVTAEEKEETGELVFRVDSYGPDPHHVMGRRGTARDELVLMGPEGECILTVRRKWPSLHQRWEGFRGERADGQKPLFSVRRYSIIGRSSGIGVEVFGDQIAGGGAGHHQYRVEGSFPQRCCAVYEVGSEGGGAEEADGEEGAVVEIRRKVVPSAAADAVCDGVVLGRDVFCLRLAPGFDAAFAMGLVLVLDQMTGDDDGGGEGRDGGESSPAAHSPVAQGEDVAHCRSPGTLLVGR